MKDLFPGTSSQAPIHVQAAGDRVLMHFAGRDVSSLAMSPDVALKVAQALTTRAREVQAGASLIHIPAGLVS